RAHAVAGVRGEAHELERRSDPRAVEAAHLRHETQRLLGARVAERGLLREVAAQGARGDRLARGVVPADRGAARVRREAEEAAEDAGLARSVRAGKRHRLAGADGERDVVEDAPPAEDEAHSLDHDERAHASTLRAAPSTPAPATRRPNPASASAGPRAGAAASPPRAGGATSGAGSVSLWRGANSGNSFAPRSIASAAGVPAKNARFGWR